MDLTELYCSVDDFWKQFDKEWQKHSIKFGKPSRGPQQQMSLSEKMTIVIMFHNSNFRTFKLFYLHLKTYHLKDFPLLLSYSRFVSLMKHLFVPLFAYILSRKGEITGIAFIDSTSIRVCHNKRIRRNLVFRKMAKRGKTTAGYFYGFKLHLIINDKGEILAFQITAGNVADVKMLDILTKDLIGKLFGDKGYISQELSAKLLQQGLELFTTLRSNMKPKLMKIEDKLLLRKRSLIETVNDQLKNISQIEHTRHRSASNFLINVLSGLAAYTHQEKKPSLNLSKQEQMLIAA